MKIVPFFRQMLPDSFIGYLKKRRLNYYNRRMLQKLKARVPFEPGYYPNGINLLGDIHAETGLGQSMRIIARMIDSTGIPYLVKQIDSPGAIDRIDQTWGKNMAQEVRYGINLIHINPGSFAEFCVGNDRSLFDHRYNIAYWLWELEDFPDCWLPCLETVDEVWTPSEFISDSIRRKTDKPVVTMPYCIDTRPGMFRRDHFGLPEQLFLFLVLYDFISMSERKNPKASIDAFRMAFSPDKAEIGLVIKVNHIHSRYDIDILKKELIDYKNVYFLTENMSREEVDSLINNVDVLISLHRSEGFGLPLAEAMSLGKPVIATNWSANTEFMNRGNSCPVDYELIKLDRNVGPYVKGSRWAEANVGQAAEYMLKLYGNRDYYTIISQMAGKAIKENLNKPKLSQRISNRIMEIYEE